MPLTTVLGVSLCHQLEKIFPCDPTTELHVDKEVGNQLWISFLGLNQLCKSSADRELSLTCLCECAEVKRLTSLSIVIQLLSID